MLVDPSWPTAAPGRIISAPDWGDYNIYPPAARAMGQEGKVRSRLLVDAEGRPTQCVVLLSSGHAELDAGHCEVMRLMRFEPARIAGRAVPSSRVISINWQLGDEHPLGRSSASANLSLSGGRIKACTLNLEGPHFLPHRVTGCLPLNRNNAVLAWLPDVSRARVEVEVAPMGETMTKPSQRLILRRLVAFDINGEGDAVNCRTLSEEGEVHRLAVTRPGGCDDLLRSVWFAAPAEGERLSGQYEIRVTRPR